MLPVKVCALRKMSLKMISKLLLASVLLLCSNSTLKIKVDLQSFAMINTSLL